MTREGGKEDILIYFVKTFDLSPSLLASYPFARDFSFGAGRRVESKPGHDVDDISSTTTTLLCKSIMHLTIACCLGGYQEAE